jgi:hypothetical protein
MAAFQRIGDDQSKDRLVDTQEKETNRFSYFARAVWPADRRRTLPSRRNIAGFRFDFLAPGVQAVAAGVYPITNGHSGVPMTAPSIARAWCLALALAMLALGVAAAPAEAQRLRLPQKSVRLIAFNDPGFPKGA